MYDFNRAIELGDARAVCYHHRGICFARLGKPAEALADLNKAIEIDPDDARAYRDRAEVYAAAGKNKKAEADFTTSISKNRHDARAYFGRGYLHSLAGRNEPAVSDFTAAIRHDKTHAMAFHRRGEALVSLGKLPQAIHDFEAAIRLDENLIAAYCSRGLAVARAGKPGRAAIELTKAGGRIRHDIRFALAFDCRGRVYYSMGQYQRAIRDFDIVLELNPPGHNFVQTYYGRALALLQLADYEQAGGCLRKAIELSPEHGDARALLKWLNGGREGTPAALRRPSAVVPLAKPPQVIPPVPLDAGHQGADDPWHVEPVWDQWLVKLESGPEFGPVTKQGLDVWCSEGRLGENTKVLRVDWEDWELAAGVYPELAIATHRTTNRPIPVQPAPSVAEVMDQSSAAAPQPFPDFQIDGSPAAADDDALPEISV